MAKSKNNFYTVWVGRQVGVLNSWAETDAATKGFAGAKFKGFKTEEQAQYALSIGWESYYAPKEKASAEIDSAPEQVQAPVLVQQEEDILTHNWETDGPLF